MNNEIETHHNLITIDQEKMMTSLELAEAFGQEHKRVLGRLQKIIDDNDVFITGLHYGLVEYRDAKGEMRPMLEINFDVAFTFAVTSRKDHAMQLVKSMFETRIEELKSKMEQKLKQDNEKLKNDVRIEKAKQLEDSDNVERVVRRSHAALKELYEEGICDMDIRFRRFYSWPVTEYGREQGWYNNQNGTLVHPEMD